MCRSCISSSAICGWSNILEHSPCDARDEISQMLGVGAVMGMECCCKGKIGIGQQPAGESLQSSMVGGGGGWVWSSIAKTVLAKAREGSLKKRMLYTDVVQS